MGENTGQFLYILGAGGQAGKVLLLSKLMGFVLKGFISTEPIGTMKHGYPVLGTHTDLKGLFSDRGNAFNIAIGEPFVRERISEQLQQKTADGNQLVFPVLAHPSAYVAANALIAEGTFIGAQAVVEFATQIGRHCFIDSGTIVEHDCRIADFVNISPGAVIAGGVSIGDNTIIGAGATVRENCTIGSQAVIGAGAVVVQNVPDFAVVAGVPAKVLRYRETGERTYK